MNSQIRHILRLTIVLIGLIFSSCLVRDADSLRPDDIFVKYYGALGAESFVDLVFYEDANEYFLLGNSTSSETSDLSDFYVVRTRDDGSLINNNVIDFEDNTSQDIASSIKILNNRIAIIGSRQVRNDQIFESKKIFYVFLDFELNIIGRGEISSTTGKDLEGNDIILTEDGNYVILGTEGEELGRDRDLVIVKIQPDGTEIWRRENRIPGDDAGVSLVQFDNGEIAICAETDRVSVKGYLGKNILFITLNRAGLINNSLSYGRTFNDNIIIDDVPTKMIKDGVGATIIGSSLINNNQEPFILSLTSNGAVGDIRVVSVEGQEGIIFRDITRSIDGDYLITGDFLNYINDETSEKDQSQKRQEVLFLRTDQFGTTNKSINHFGDSFDESGNAIIQLPDGKILIGMTIGFGAGNTKMGLLKTNKNGKLLK